MNCPFLLLVIDYFATYLTTEKRYSSHTVESYINDLDQFSSYLLDQFQEEPAKASPIYLRSWVSHLMEQSYAPTSVHRKISTLRAYYRFLQKRGERDDNPAKTLPRPKKRPNLPSFVEESAMSKLQLSTNSDSDFHEKTQRLLISLLYETGMRQAEILGIDDASIDFRLGQLRVVGKRSKVRFVPLSKALVDQLIQYKSERKSNFGETNPGTFLVTGTNKKITKSFVYRVVRLYLSEVTTAKKRSPHVLRHTFATHMLNNGADLNVIKEILGHSSLAATQVYTHNNIEKLRQVHQQMHPRNKS